MLTECCKQKGIPQNDAAFSQQFDQQIQNVSSDLIYRYHDAGLISSDHKVNHHTDFYATFQ